MDDFSKNYIENPLYSLLNLEILDKIAVLLIIHEVFG